MATETKAQILERLGITEAKAIEIAEDYNRCSQAIAPQAKPTEYPNVPLQRLDRRRLVTLFLES